MTAILTRSSKRTIGQEIYTQAWRQMAVGLAIKFFGGENLPLDLDLPGDVDDGLTPDQFNPKLLPEAVHWQASHTPRTGNQIYGGTVDFRQGLTDAGLQEYLLMSKG